MPSPERQPRAPASPLRRRARRPTEAAPSARLRWAPASRTGLRCSWRRSSGARAPVGRTRRLEQLTRERRAFAASTSGSGGHAPTTSATAAPMRASASGVRSPKSPTDSRGPSKPPWRGPRTPACAKRMAANLSGLPRSRRAERRARPKGLRNRSASLRIGPDGLPERSESLRRVRISLGSELLGHRRVILGLRRRFLGFKIDS